MFANFQLFPRMLRSIIAQDVLNLQYYGRTLSKKGCYCEYDVKKGPNEDMEAIKKIVDCDRPKKPKSQPPVGKGCSCFCKPPPFRPCKRKKYGRCDKRPIECAKLKFKCTKDDCKSSTKIRDSRRWSFCKYSFRSHCQYIELNNHITYM